VALDIVTEAEFQRAVVELAYACGWRVQHSRTIQTRNGRWMTPILGHTGFPDLCLAHRRHGVLFAELKTTKGRLTADQQLWQECLAAHLEYHVWRPADWPHIVNRLKGTPAT